MGVESASVAEALTHSDTLEISCHSPSLLPSSLAKIWPFGPNFAYIVSSEKYRTGKFFKVFGAKNSRSKKNLTKP